MADKPEDKKEEGPDAKHRISVVLDGVDKGAASIAGTVLGFPVDAMNWGLSFIGLGSEKPVGGSKWITEKVGDVTEAQNKALKFTPPEHVDQTDKNLFAGAKFTTELAVGATAIKLMLPPAAAGAQTINTTAQAAKIAATAPKIAAAPAAESFAGSVASASWWTTKAVAKTVTFPLTHTKTSLVLAAGAHQLTDGASTHALIDGAVGTWNFVGDHAPGVRDAVGDTALKVGTELTKGAGGMVTTVAERTGEAVLEKIPNGPGLPLTWNLFVDGVKQKGKQLKESLTGTGGSGKKEDSPILDSLEDAGSKLLDFADANKGTIAAGTLLGMKWGGGAIMKSVLTVAVTALLVETKPLWQPLLAGAATWVKHILGDFLGKYIRKDGKPEITKNPLTFTKTELKPGQTSAPAPVTAKPGETIMGTDGKPVALSEEHLPEPKISTVDVQQGTTKITKLFSENANDPIEKRVEARLEQHLADLREKTPNSPYLDPKNEEKYRTLMTKTFTAQIREEESQAQKLATQKDTPAKVYFQPQPLDQPLMLSMR